LADFLDALGDGFTAARADGLPQVGVCVSLKRTQSAAEALDLVDRVVALRHPSVVALSIDGNEAAAGRTGPRFAAAFAEARAAGLHCCAHAGESSGPEGVRDAIDVLGAERIDHGVRAVEDPALVRRLAADGIPLDICPTSNVRLGVAPTLALHPVEALRRAGVRVSLNTDDPVLFETTVDGEYDACADTFGWTEGSLAEVARTSIESSFAAAGLRQDLLRDLDAYLRSTP
jgi:adenosine deaminase